MIESCLPCAKINSSIFTLQNIYAKTLKRLFSFRGQISIGDNNNPVSNLLKSLQIRQNIFSDNSIFFPKGIKS